MLGDGGGGLWPEVDFDTVGDPGGQADAEEIEVLGPDGKLQHKGDGDNRPVVGIAAGNSLAGGSRKAE